MRGKSARSLEELWEVVGDIWDTISPNYINTLIDSMPERLLAIKKARGGYTKY